MLNSSSGLTGDVPQTREAFAASQSHSHLAFMQQELSEPSQGPFIDIRFSEYPSEMRDSSKLPTALSVTF